MLASEDCATASHNDCSVCPVRACMVRRASSTLASALLGIMDPPVAVMPRANPLFVAGEWSDAIYTVRGGCLKTFTVDASGSEHIRGFHLPGDWIGLDTLTAPRFGASATAIVPSQVCVTPLAKLRQLMAREPELGGLLADYASRELALALSQLGDYSAEQRIAAFLLRMRERLSAWDGTLLLPMTRRDIGNSMRMAMETVSRTLKGFERNGWLRCEDRCIRLLSTRPLFELAAAVGVEKRLAEPQLAQGCR